ncbi:MAG TPA: glycine cleavage system protein GcvH [Candidatus Krumholzibacteria bacterium]
MMRPDDLKYTREHEWVRIEGGEAVIGITDFAADELGDIVFLELPEAGQMVLAGEPLGTIETVKAVEELYSPLSGEVIESNPDLSEQPEKVNADPYGDGWMVRVRIAELDENELMDAAAYGEMVDG